VGWGKARRKVFIVVSYSYFMESDKATLEDFFKECDKADRLVVGADTEDATKAFPVLWRNFMREVRREKGNCSKYMVAERLGEIWGVSTQEVLNEYKQYRELYLDRTFDGLYFSSHMIVKR